MDEQAVNMAAVFCRWPMCLQPGAPWQRCAGDVSAPGGADTPGLPRRGRHFQPMIGMPALIEQAAARAMFDPRMKERLDEALRTIHGISETDWISPDQSLRHHAR